MSSEQDEPQELNLSKNGHYVVPMATECVGIFVDFTDGEQSRVQFRLTGNILIDIPLSKTAAANTEDLLKPLIASETETAATAAK